MPEPSSLFAIRIAPRKTDALDSETEVWKRAQGLSDALGAPLIPANHPHDAKFEIVFTHGGRLELRFAHTPAIKPIRVDLTPRQRNYGSDPLIRAVGTKPCDIVDGTAGFGVDAAHLVAANHRVIAIEQHPLLYAMLADGHMHLQDVAFAARLQLVYANTLEWLAELTQPVDVIYLDPMYPPRQNHAASRKGIRLLQELIPYQPEWDRDILALARRRARRRVVVKRPRHADALLSGKSGETKGKLVRFDIYSPSF